MAMTAPSAGEDMLALYQRIQEDARPESIVIDGRQYTTRKVHPVHQPGPEAPLEVSTLEAVAQYVNAGIDKADPKRIFLRVASPSEVRLETWLHPGFCERFCLLRAKAPLPEHQFGRWLCTEDLSIWLQSCFCGNPVLEEGAPVNSKAGILKYISRVVKVSEAALSDDGTAQAVEVQSALGSKALAMLPNPVKLRPYRTFIEVEQPKSSFVFRLTEDKGFRYRLDEADGGAWRIEAVKSVAEWLKSHVSADVPILS